MDQHKNILDMDKNEVPTIEDALSLVGKKGESIEHWKIKALGLRQVLLGLAEVQALRVSKLAGMVFRLEDELMSEDKIRELEPKQLFGLYRTATEQMTVASDYITAALKTTNWADFESGLLQSRANEASGGEDSGISDISGDLLAIIAKAKAGKLDPDDDEQVS